MAQMNSKDLHREASHALAECLAHARVRGHTDLAAQWCATLLEILKAAGIEPAESKPAAKKKWVAKAPSSGEENGAR
jgi:hypothetical protein